MKDDTTRRPPDLTNLTDQAWTPQLTPGWQPPAPANDTAPTVIEPLPTPPTRPPRR